MSALENALNTPAAPVAPSTEGSSNSLQSVANQIAGQQSALQAPAGQQPTIPSPSAGLIEIDAPDLSQKLAEPVNKDSYARRTFKNPDDVYNAYDELFTKSFSGIGEVKNNTAKLAESINTLPDLLAAKLAEILKPATPEPPKPASTPSGAANGAATAEQFGNLKFSADDIIDGTFADKLNTLTQAIGKLNVPQVNKDELVTALSGQMKQTVETMLAEREQQRMQTQIQQEMQSLVKQGHNENLVKTAVILGAQTGKNSVSEAWQEFQKTYPQFFQKENVNNMIAEQAGQRVNIPVDLNGSTSRVTTVDEFQRNLSEALRRQTASEALGI